MSGVGSSHREHVRQAFRRAERLARPATAATRWRAAAGLAAIEALTER